MFKLFQKSSLQKKLSLELYGYTFNKQFFPSNIKYLRKCRTSIMILRAPKHFKVGKHILHYYSNFFRLLFSIAIASPFLPTLIRNSNKTNFFICQRLLPYSGTYTTIVLKYKIKFKYKVSFNMTGVWFVYVIIYIPIFSCIFWILTYSAKLLYSNKYYNYKLNFYECGFKSFTANKIQYNINYIMLILFLLVYDGEFLILIPISLNLTCTNLHMIFCLFCFLYWLLLALVLDYVYNALDWQV